MEKNAPFSIQIIASGDGLQPWRATLTGWTVDMDLDSRQTIWQSLLDVMHVTPGWTRLEIQRDGIIGCEGTSERSADSGKEE